ncbi:ELWxxDGT repeat protein [Dyadobacter sediminis]|uniref:DNRLRE domain-containing protein n=1 Tax=Dyadobacter sediminis TaxID=1493691 RepID=A0A5R9KDU4_9BACT|nr:ELWxxDGT repeat protein [Dyadobacter sediminis]TLU94302.1 DNRLRE domain-containing protein [Dyadobacter sediminis]GGB92465.1 hypothetical protein GCM10011325_19880 [Dyadobacter sediminis]
MKRIVLYLALFLMSMQLLLAQEGSLLKDINVTGSAVNGLRIYESIAVDNIIYMIADNGLEKKGIWKSDGTAGGTVLIKEITEVPLYRNYVRHLTYSGGKIYFVVELESGLKYLYKLDVGQTSTTSSLQLFQLDYADEVFVNVNGTLYFGTSKGLMKTDGTVAGTVLVKPFYESYGSPVNYGVSLNGMLYFLVLNNFEKIILYKSDGTTEGTVAVTNTTGSNPSAPLVALGDNVYFKQVLPSGTALFKANNTTPVTLVRQFTSGLSNLVSAGNELYFSANDGVNGNELWKTDGSTAGTVLVKNINPGAASSDPSMFRTADGQLFFVANDGTHGRELWKTGGTASSTKLVRDIRTGDSGSDIKELVTVGSKAAFVANDGSGEKLWQSNGDVYSTKILADVMASKLLNVSGTLYFNGNAGKGMELFKSTMVTGGTSAVTNIAKPSSIPLDFTEINGVSYFTADDGIYGRKLWKTDGSTAGTMLVTNIQSGASSSNPEQITNVNGTVFFVTGNDSQVHSLWKTSGTTATTFKVKDFTKADTLQGLINVNGTLFFGIINSSGSMQLWKSDGSTAGTQLVKTFPQTDTFSPVTLNGQVYFGAYDGINSVDLWKSNGTAEGTVLVKDVAPTWGESMYTSITVAGNFIYYIVVSGNYKNALVKSDGTTEGTTVVSNIRLEYLSKLVAVNDLVFFVGVDGAAFDDYSGEILYRTDGTEQGTYTIAKLETIQGDPYIYVHDMVAVNGLLYFVHGFEEEIWRSDGTAEGTQRVTNFGSRADRTTIDHVTVIGKTLYFIATDRNSGREIWKTDSATETTSLAYDMNPNGSTRFYDMGALNNQLLISADNGMYGAELFRYQEINTVNTVRINAGGQAFAASGSRQFDADRYYAGIDRTSSIATGDILNTTDDVLYRSGRCSPSFSYNIPIANGKVNVILHFAETYFGTAGKKGGAGSRQFNVTIENSRKLTNFDIFAAAGGAMRAVQKSIPVTVTDGMLNIDFTSGAADLPRISAIEVVVASQTYKVVADSYIRDGGYSAANYGYFPDLEVKNVAESDASTKRSSYVRFQLPQTFDVGSAKLRIYGHNHENSKDIYLHAYGVDDDSWTENGISKNNAPAASTASLGYVAVNDQYKYYEIDVTSYVKAQQESGNDLLTLLLADPNNRNTRLVFNSKENSANPPQLVIQPASVSNSSARLNQENIAENVQAEQESVIYPNPVKEQFTVSLSMQHVGPVSFELISQAGKSYAVRTAESARPGEKAEVNISSLTLSTGIYMLKIQSNAFTEVIKMLVTE